MLPSFPQRLGLPVFCLSQYTIPGRRWQFLCHARVEEGVQMWYNKCIWILSQRRALRRGREDVCMSTEKVIPIIEIPYGVIAPRVIVCGDPARAEKIASRLDNMTVVAKTREYWTFNGSYKGVPVTVSSHGVGAAGAHVSFEGLILGGAKVMIRVGTCGTLQPGMPQGALIIATAACREDGVTQQLIPSSYPAVASYDVVQVMIEEAKKTDAWFRSGIISTGGIFYKGIIPTNNRVMADAGCLAFENEAAMLFVTCSLKGIKAGCIVAADGPCFEFVGSEEFDHHPGAMAKAVEDEITIALESIIRVEVEE